MRVRIRLCSFEICALKEPLFSYSSFSSSQRNYFWYSAKNDIIAFDNPAFRTLNIKRCTALPGDSIPQYKSLLISPFRVVPAKGDTISARELLPRALANLLENDYFQFNKEDSTFVALENFYFVLGDNRDCSDDSRLFGLVPESLILGKYLFSLTR